MTWLLWDNLRTIIIAGAAFAFGIILLLPRLPGWATGLIVLVLCCIGFLVVFLWDMKFPPPFNVDPGRRSIDYEFGNDEFGREFAVLNGAVDQVNAT